MYDFFSMTLDSPIYLDWDQPPPVEWELPPRSTPPSSQDPHLWVDDKGVWARLVTRSTPFQLNYDRGRIAFRARHGGERLLKALGLTRYPQLSIIDGTFGLGKESFLMASVGAMITGIERSSSLYYLSKDALRRGPQHICNRIHLINDDTTHLLNTLTSDVIYLDPMFPLRRKRAAVAAEAQVLQAFAAGPPSIEEEIRLLDHALSAAKYRVVVKRPKSAPPLANKASSASIKGKLVRFDIYGIKSLNF